MISRENPTCRHVSLDFRHCYCCIIIIIINIITTIRRPDKQIQYIYIYIYVNINRVDGKYIKVNSEQSVKMY
jgi:hypothetical protein